MNFLSFLLAGYALFGQPSVAPFLNGIDIGGRIDYAELRACCEKIINDPQRIWFLSDHNGKMKLQVRGIYIHGSVLLFRLRLSNRSSRDYAPESIRFQAVDKNGTPVSGHAALEPVFVYDSVKLISSGSIAAGIFVLPRFTLPAGGKLWIDVRETGGSRQLHIPVGNWMLAKARLI